MINDLLDWPTICLETQTNVSMKGIELARRPTRDLHTLPAAGNDDGHGWQGVVAGKFDLWMMLLDDHSKVQISVSLMPDISVQNLSLASFRTGNWTEAATLSTGYHVGEHRRSRTIWPHATGGSRVCFQLQHQRRSNIFRGRLWQSRGWDTMSRKTLFAPEYLSSRNQERIKHDSRYAGHKPMESDR